MSMYLDELFNSKYRGVMGGLEAKRLKKCLEKFLEAVTAKIDFVQLLSTTAGVDSGEDSDDNGLFLKSVHFTVSGIGPERKELREKALKHGATYSHDYSSNVSHVVVNNVNPMLNTPKVQQGCREGKSIVTRDWIDDSIAQQRMLESKYYNPMIKRRRLTVYVDQGLLTKVMNGVNKAIPDSIKMENLEDIDSSLEDFLRYDLDELSQMISDNESTGDLGEKEANYIAAYLLVICDEIIAKLVSANISADTFADLCDKVGLSQFLASSSTDPPKELTLFEIYDHTSTLLFSVVPFELYREIASFIDSASALLHLRLINKRFNNIVAEKNNYLWRNVTYSELIDNRFYPLIDKSFTMKQFEERMPPNTDWYKLYIQYIYERNLRFESFAEEYPGARTQRYVHEQIMTTIYVAMTGESDNAVTQVGGTPTLPPAFQYNPHMGNFIVQIAFSELKHTLAPILPDHGVLYLFFNSDSQKGFGYYYDNYDLSGLMPKYDLKFGQVQKLSAVSEGLSCPYSEHLDPHHYDEWGLWKDYAAEAIASSYGCPESATHAMLCHPLSVPYDSRDNRNSIVIWQSLSIAEDTICFYMQVDDLKARKFDKISAFICDMDERYSATTE